MDKTKDQQNAATSKPSINAMAKMMAMQASLPELIFNLKLMGVKVGDSIINPAFNMMIIQNIETAIEKSGNEKAINSFNTAAMMSGNGGKIDPMTMMLMSGGKDIDPMMLMLMNKDGDKNNMLPLLMMNGGLDKFKDNPMMLSMLMGGKMDTQTLMMMQMMKGKDGKGGLF